MAEQPPRRPKREDIQGLRALAVLLVVAAHSGVPGVAGGFVGVDVFFVLSGFLITGLLIGEGERFEKISLAGFYSRRARRILPAATLVLIATIAFTAVWEATADLEVVVTDAIWSAVFLANVHFAVIGTNYSDGEAPSAMQHYWSLGVEEQFYLVWPLLFIALLALKARRRHLVLAVAGVWLLSLAWSVWTTTDSPITAYFSSPARAYELATGALVAVAAPWL
ncbi:MAG: acyltransferase, partial [Nocardioides sp.]|nr:acyltransferase [Nocardioides sp.]